MGVFQFQLLVNKENLTMPDTPANATWLDALQPIASGLLRHVLTVVGGGLLTHGYITSSGKEQIISAGMILGGAAWSWWQKVGQAQVAADIANLRAILAQKAAAGKAPTQNVAKVLAWLIVPLALVLLVAAPAHAQMPTIAPPAQAQPPVVAPVKVHHAAIKKRGHVAETPRVPRTEAIAGARAQATGKPAAAPAPGTLTTTTAQKNPLLVLQTFTITDLQNALADAQAQTPPDTVAATCYQALIPLVQNANGAKGLIPKSLGAVQVLQKARDAKQFLATLNSPTGPLAGLNVACAPLVLDVQTTLIQLGIISGAVVGTAATGGLTLPFFPLTIPPL